MRKVSSLNPRIVPSQSLPIRAFPHSFPLNRFFHLRSFNTYCSHSKHDNGGMLEWLMITPRKS